MLEDERQAMESGAPGARRQAPTAWLPIALGVVAGLVICVVGALVQLHFHPSIPDPAPTAHAICADLSSQRYDNLYTLLSPDLQAQGTSAQFVASQRELDRLLGPVRVCQAGATNPIGGVVDVTLTLQRTQRVTAHVLLNQTSGSWRISNYGQTV